MLEIKRTKICLSDLTFRIFNILLGSQYLAALDNLQTVTNFKYFVNTTWLKMGANLYKGFLNTSKTNHIFLNICNGTNDA